MFGVSRQQLYRLSRDRSFLLRAGVAIVLASVALAIVIWILIGRGYSEHHGWRERAERDSVALVESLRNLELLLYVEERDKQKWWFEDPLGEEVDETPRFKDPSVEAELLVESSNVSEAEKEVLLAYAEYLYPGKSSRSTQAVRDAATEELKQAAQAGVAFAAECYGDSRTYADDEADARKYYEMELEVRESKYCRDRIVEIALDQKDYERLEELIQEGDLRKASLYWRLEVHKQMENLGPLFWTVLEGSTLHIKPVYGFLSLFVALIWMILVGQMAGFRKGQILVYATAIGLGILSAITTLYVVYLHDIVGGVQESDDLMNGLIFWIAGVGLREETIKLLFFLPLIPWLRRRGNEMEVLVAAGFVGLGFALEENISYYMGATGETVISRFLTANFFHLSLTGLIGYSCYRMTRYPKRTWDAFLSTYLLMVAAHGLYNAFWSLPDLYEYQWYGAIFVFALVAYRFFGVADNLKWTGSQQISPLGVFVLGFALLIGGCLNVFCFGADPHPTYLRFLLQCIILTPVAFFFVNRFRDA